MPDAENIAVGNEYDVIAWLQERFGFNNERFVGAEIAIIMPAREAARVQFEVLITHDDLANLLSRKKS
jgi:hypothetical protein